MAVCDDLRLGGTLSGTGIAGGTSINNTALLVDDWSSIFGNGGLSYTPFQSLGRPGSFMVGDGLPKPRLFNLNMRVTRWGPNNYTLTEPSEPEQLTTNTDNFLALLQTPTYLEVDMPDGTERFLTVRSIDPSAINQRARTRTISVPLATDWPYWRAGGNQSSDTLTGADTVTINGNVNVYDAVLVFSGDLTLTCAALGWALTVAGSAGAVTVDLGNRTVTQGGNPAENLLTYTNAKWGWFAPGANSVTVSAGNVAITWRDQWA